MNYTIFCVVVQDVGAALLCVVVTGWGISIIILLLKL